MPEDPLAKYKAKNVGDPLAKYKAPTQIPEEEPLQEMGVNLEERTALKSFAGDIPSQLEWLQREPGVEGKPKSFGLFVNDKGEAAIPWAKAHQYEAREYKPGHIAVRLKGSTGPWKVVDPDTGLFSKDILADIWDIAPELAAGYAVPASKPLAIGATMATGEGLGGLVGKEVLGFKQGYGDIAKSAAEKGAAGTFGGYALGKATPLLVGGAKALGRGIQKPAQWLEGLTKEEAKKAWAQEGKNLGIEAKEIETLRKAETVSARPISLEERELGIEAQRLKTLKNEASRAEEEVRKKGRELLSQTKTYREAVEKQAEINKANIKSNLAQEKLKAAEAKQAAKKIKPVQKEEILNQPSQAIKNTSKAEDEQLIGDIFSNAHRETFKINENWADQRFELGDLRADGVIGRYEHKILGKEFAKDAKELRENIWKLAYRDVVDILKKQGIPEEEAIARAGVARQTAEVNQALGRFDKSDYSKVSSGIMFGRIKKERISEVLDKISNLPERKNLEALKGAIRNKQEQVDYRKLFLKQTKELAPKEIAQRESALAERELAHKIGEPQGPPEGSWSELLTTKPFGTLSRAAMGATLGYPSGVTSMVLGGILGAGGVLGTKLAGKGGAALEKLANRISTMPPEAQREFLMKFPAIKAALYGLRVSP